MTSNVFFDLLGYVHKYYPVGCPTYKTSQENEIRSKIADKLNDKSEVHSQWNNLMMDFRKLGFSHVENMSYLQFPNLMVSLDENHEVTGIKITKSIVVCISLLAPFYTYYYRYSHKVKLAEGSLPMGYWVFFQDKSYDALKPSVNLESLNFSISNFFRSYNFISHYPLMINQIEGGLPFGQSKEYYQSSKHGFYQFLFDENQPQNVFA